MDPSRARADRWLRSHRPDVIVADSTSLKTFQTMDGPLVVLLDRSSDDTPAGIDQLPGEIGRSAVELLAGKITRGEFGLPEHPQVTMVGGVWCEAESARHDGSSRSLESKTGGGFALGTRSGFSSVMESILRCPNLHSPLHE